MYLREDVWSSKEGVPKTGHHSPWILLALSALGPRLAHVMHVDAKAGIRKRLERFIEAFLISLPYAWYASMDSEPL